MEYSRTRMYHNVFYYMPLCMNIQVVSSLCCNKPASVSVYPGQRISQKVLPERKAFSEYLLCAVFIKYTIETCDRVPSSQSAKYSWGNKPNPHKTIELCKTGLTRGAPCSIHSTQMDAKFSLGMVTHRRDGAEVLLAFTF